MTTTKKPTRPAIKLVGGHAITTSTAVAEFFGRRHDDVLKRIRQVIADCPPEYHLRNFAEASREVDAGKGAKVTYTEYRLTRDGFTLLAMGFTGKAALAWKIKYIEAFNQLESRATAHTVKMAERRALAEQRKALPAPDKSVEQLAIERLSKARLMLHFAANGNAVVYQLPRNARVLAAEELADFIGDADMVESKYLPGIIKAVAQRLG